jgi:superfamily I DNA/RNA helicase
MPLPVQGLSGHNLRGLHPRGCAVIAGPLEAEIPMFLSCGACGLRAQLTIGDCPPARKVPGALTCPRCGQRFGRVDVASWSRWVHRQVRWKRSQQNVGALGSRRQAVQQSEGDIDRDGLAAELAACVLLCPAYLDEWRAGQEEGTPNRGRDLPSAWTGLARPVEVKQTRYRDTRTGYLLVRPPRGVAGPMRAEHVDDSIYVLLIGKPWEFELIGWADRELLLADGKPNPVPVRQGQRECLGLHWTQLRTLPSLPGPELLPAFPGKEAVATADWLSIVPAVEDATGEGASEESPADAWELNLKAAFLTDLLAMPDRKAARQVQEEVEELQRDPRPDGCRRRRLEDCEEVIHASQVGLYQLLYTFGPGWIRLLGLRLCRDNRTREGQPGLAAINRKQPVPGQEALAVGLVPPPLPCRLTPALLTELQVAPAFHPVLMACPDEEALLAAAVPEDVRLRVAEALFPCPVEQVLGQPDLALARSEDLVAFADGRMDLKDFLLRLDPDQEKAVDASTRGPLLVKGGPGVGKSITLLYRIRSLLNQTRPAAGGPAEHGPGVFGGAVCVRGGGAGSEDGSPPPRVLLTTYTSTLCSFSRQLLVRLLGKDGLRHVTVHTADKLARDIVRQHGKLDGEIAGQDRLREILREVRKQSPGTEVPAPAMPPRRIRDDYLLDEFAWVIEGRGITTRKEYQEADRAGRGVRLTTGERDAVWNLYRTFRQRLDAEGLLSWGQVRGRARALVREGAHVSRFDAILVDEAQDLTPHQLGLLVDLCRSSEGVCLAADANQSLYSRGFTWQDVNQGLRFRGRTVILKGNYRTTWEITLAAASFLAAGGGVDEEALGARCPVAGPVPVLQPYRDDRELAALTAGFLRSCCLRNRLKLQSAAVLVPTQRWGRVVAETLCTLGVAARFMAGAELDLEADVVKVLTLHSAKGLEFPTVVVAGLEKGVLPRVLRNAGPEEQQEEDQCGRRLVFVGMTRAMQNLLLLYPTDRPSPFVADLIGDGHVHHAPALPQPLPSTQRAEEGSRPVPLRLPTLPEQQR